MFVKVNIIYVAWYRSFLDTLYLSEKGKNSKENILLTRLLIDHSHANDEPRYFCINLISTRGDLAAETLQKKILHNLHHARMQQA